MQVWCCWQVTLCDPHLSTLEVRFSRRCATQIDVYLTNKCAFNRRLKHTIIHQTQRRRVQIPNSQTSDASIYRKYWNIGLISIYHIVSPAEISKFSIYRGINFWMDISSCWIFTYGVKKSWNFHWNFDWIFLCEKISSNFRLLQTCQNFRKQSFDARALAFHRSVKMHIGKTLKKLFWR